MNFSRRHLYIDALVLADQLGLINICSVKSLDLNKGDLLGPIGDRDG